MNRILILFSAVLMTITVVGQDTTDQVVKHKYFKMSPFALFEPETSLQFAYEYPLKDNVGIEHEVGLITSELFQNIMLNRSFFGVKTKHEIRYYRPNQNGNTFFYHGPQVMYKFVQNNITEELWMDSYWQNVDYTVKRHVVALNYKIGILQESKNMPLIWDWFIGFGYRYNMIDKNDVPSEVGGSVIWYESIFGIDKNHFGVICPTAGVKIGLLTRK